MLSCCFTRLSWISSGVLELVEDEAEEVPLELFEEHALKNRSAASNAVDCLTFIFLFLSACLWKGNYAGKYRLLLSPWPAALQGQNV